MLPLHPLYYFYFKQNYAFSPIAIATPFFHQKMQQLLAVCVGFMIITCEDFYECSLSVLCLLSLNNITWEKFEQLGVAAVNTHNNVEEEACCYTEGALCHVTLRVEK